jgi:hypothetical protein
MEGTGPSIRFGDDPNSYQTTYNHELAPKEAEIVNASKDLINRNRSSNIRFHGANPTYVSHSHNVHKKTALP